MERLTLIPKNVYESIKINCYAVSTRDTKAYKVKWNYSDPERVKMELTPRNSKYSSISLDEILSRHKSRELVDTLLKNKIFGVHSVAEFSTGLIGGLPPIHPTRSKKCVTKSRSYTIKKDTNQNSSFMITH